MATMRVYATDSFVVPVTANPRSGEVLWTLDQKQHRDPVVMETVYDLDYDPMYPPLYNPVRSCQGVLLQYDFGAIPALQGMKITKITGPFVYLSARDLSIKASHGGTTFGWHTDNPFLIFNNEIPTNPVGNMPLDSYCDLRFGRGELPWLTGGVHSSRLLTGCRAYPDRAGRYAGRGQLVFDSHAMPHKPYVDIEYEPANIIIADVSPGTGFVDEHIANRLSWNIKSADRYTVGTITQARATVQWRIQGTTSVSLVDIEGGNTSVDIPAGSFPNEKIEWRVRAVSTLGVETPYSEWARLTTIDSTPDAPRFLSPDGRVVNGGIDNIFAWEHAVDTGSRQYRYRTEFSADGNVWEPYADEITDRQNMTVPANYLPAGQVYWRVRTYNSDGVAGDWAVASATVRRAEEAPVVSVTGTSPRPEVSWQARGQVCFQVAAPGFDSGAVYGAARQYRLPVYLPDGENEIRVRVCNQYEMWSDWGRAIAHVENRPTGSIALHVREVECGVRLFWRGDYAHYDVLRDGAVIARVEQPRCDDWLADGLTAHEYQVRGMTDEGYYTLSAAVYARSRVAAAAIAEAGVWEWLPLRYRLGGAPELSRSITPEVAYHAYSGRALPVATLYGRASESAGASYTVAPALLEQLAALGGRTVALRHGALLVRGVLDSVSASAAGDGDEVDVQLSITAAEDCI